MPWFWHLLMVSVHSKDFPGSQVNKWSSIVLYYVMELWILCKSSASADLLWHHASVMPLRKEGHCLIISRWVWMSRVTWTFDLHWLLRGRRKECLITAGWRWKFRLSADTIPGGMGRAVSLPISWRFSTWHLCFTLSCPFGFSWGFFGLSPLVSPDCWLFQYLVWDICSKKKTQWTHCHILPLVSRSPGVVYFLFSTSQNFLIFVFYILSRAFNCT